jgi:hypothetical protein
MNFVEGSQASGHLPVPYLARFTRERKFRFGRSGPRNCHHFGDRSAFTAPHRSEQASAAHSSDPKKDRVWDWDGTEVVSYGTWQETPALGYSRAT